MFILWIPLAAGCSRSPKLPVAAIEPPPAPSSVTFLDVTEQAGVQFVYHNGANGDKWLPETMGPGACFIDYDGDGWQDIFFVNGRDWTDAELQLAKKTRRAPTKGMTTCRLFRNKGDGAFEDVTERMGIAVEMYGMGCCVGDYDNDGDDDLYVTALYRNHLFRNDGGKFTEVAEQSGVQDSGWSTSAAFVDCDKDGDLDLFVCHYVKWTPDADLFCTLFGGEKSYCTPESYEGEAPKLFRNDGGKFTDVTASLGILKTGEGKPAQGKSLGVALCDYNNDGWLDIAVANDTQPNYLYRNERGKGFTDVAPQAGVAYAENGQARGAMGIDAADFDRSGRHSLLIGNFSNQMLALYHNMGNELFIDQAPNSGLGRPSLLFLIFGVGFFDFDNDGWQDLMTANGHVEDDIQRVQEQVTFAQRPLLFRNLGRQSEQVNFQEIGLQCGESLHQAIVGRGLAYADYDLDGDVDVLLCNNRGPAVLLRNDGGNRNHALRLHLIGGSKNPSAIGAIVKVTVSGETQSYWVRSGSSYCSQSELPLTIGLGGSTKADAISIQWLNGSSEVLRDVKADQILTVEEGKGVTAAKPFASGITN